MYWQRFLEKSERESVSDDFLISEVVGSSKITSRPKAIQPGHNHSIGSNGCSNSNALYRRFASSTPYRDAIDSARKGDLE